MLFWQLRTQHSNEMSYQTTNYLTAPTSPNPYVTWKLNNMDKAKALKEERKDWTRIYYKTLKGIEMMIDMQRWVRDMMKIVAEANMTITEVGEVILKASINNQIINTTNIAGVLEDLKYLVQSNMENWIFQIQWMLADKLDAYKGKGNIYMDNNIWEIQDLYKEEEVKKEGSRMRK